MSGPPTPPAAMPTTMARIFDTARHYRQAARDPLAVADAPAKLPHSERSTSARSTRAARRAGRMLTAMASSRMRLATAPRVAGSSG